MTDEPSPIRLTPINERDALIRELVETTHYVDPVTGEPYATPVLPVVIDPEGADSE
jgi:hypothetical protein